MLDDATAYDSGDRLGTRLAMLIAIPIIFAGIYFLIAPITDLRTTTGAIFGCGSAINPPNDEFKTTACGEINSHYLIKGLLTITAGILVALCGLFAFRTPRDTSDHKSRTKFAKTSVPAPLPDDFGVSSQANQGNRGRARSFD